MNVHRAKRGRAKGSGAATSPDKGATGFSPYAGNQFAALRSLKRLQHPAGSSPVGSPRLQPAVTDQAQISENDCAQEDALDSGNRFTGGQNRQRTKSPRGAESRANATGPDPNIVSSFRPSSQNMVANGKGLCILAMNPGERLCFTGMVSVAVISGSVSILGALLGAEPNWSELANGKSTTAASPTGLSFMPCYSPKSHSLLVLQAVGKDGRNTSYTYTETSDSTTAYAVVDLLATLPADAKRDHIIVALKNIESYEMTDIEKMLPNAKGLFTSDSEVGAFAGIKGFYPMFRQEADLCAVNILTPWEDATEQILNSNETPVVCIVGSKNMGKSTLSRYVVNSLLNKYQSVAFLECDVGQSEFTPAGLLSLNIVTTPLLGPPFTHMQPPYHSLLIGATSPKDDPDYYLACLRQLCSTYRTELSCGPQGAPVPLVINTHGWVKGMGLDLLIHLLRLANPTDILQLAVPEFAPQSSYKNIPVDLLSTLTPSGTELPRVALLPTNVNDTIREKFRAHDLRALQATAYFYQTASATGMMTPRWQFHIPLTARVPFQVPFGQVRIRFMHLEVPVDQTLYALNGTMVALVIDRSIPTEVSPVADDMGEEPQPASSLRVIPWNTPLSAEAHHCVGLGIIRGVDLSSEMFHVLTGPIPKDLLQRVNTFVRAPALDLPAPFFTHGYDATRAHLPYTTKLPLEGVGSVAWKTRRNLLRRRPTKE